jgi:2',3'-cyclic-nucleotide 2'-phosphodiesterase (5'-nucleotidase family)
MTIGRRCLVAFSLVAVAAVAAGPLHGEGKRVRILHTNDMHASFVPHEAMWVKNSPRPLVGGFVELEHAIDSMRAAAPATLLLDAGDVMTGNPITEREYHGAKGGLLFAMMNELGYDAWTPGNHDLDISQENLRALAAIAQFPTVNANLVDAENRFRLNNRPTLIVERGGIRVGIIGIMLQDLYAMVNQKNLIGVRVLPPVETVQRYVDELDPQTDLIVALTHQGVEDDSVLASRVHGLDVIVGGHSHTRL